MDKRLLRWLTIVLPVGFWIVVLYVSNLVVLERFSSLQTFISVVFLTLGAIVFSTWVFRIIDQHEMEIKRRANQLEALHEAALVLTTELDLGVVLQKVVDLSRKLVNARYGALGVLDPGGRRFEHFISSGLTDKERASMGEVPKGEGVFSVLIKDGKPLRLKDISMHERAVGFPSNHPEMNTLLGVPVVSKGKVIGDLYLADKIGTGSRKSAESPSEFTAQDQQMLEMFASQAAIAIENARLYRQVQELAIFEERERFGMDLHDGIIQSIYAVGLLLENIQRKIVAEPENSKGRITDAIHGLNDVIRDIRNYILDLRPQRFQGRDLLQGLEELARELRANTFVTVNLKYDNPAPSLLTPEQTVEILHIAQEALINVRKHARATDVNIHLQSLDGHLLLDIRDNGGSIKPSEIFHSKGDGLRNMRERTAGLRGEIMIEPLEDGGTHVLLHVPLPVNEKINTK